MPEPAADHYAALGLSPTAAAEIEAAYRRLAAAHHPGLLRSPGEAAHAVLADPGRRAAYDRERRATARQDVGAEPGAPGHPATDRPDEAGAAAARARRPATGDDRR